MSIYQLKSRFQALLRPAVKRRAIAEAPTRQPPPFFKD